MNEYTIEIVGSNGQDDLRTEVAATPDQALWQAFGVWVQGATAWRVDSVELNRSTDRHFAELFSGLLAVSCHHAHGCKPEDRITFKIISIEVDKSERDLDSLPPIRVTPGALAASMGRRLLA